MGTGCSAAGRSTGGFFIGKRIDPAPPLSSFSGWKVWIELHHRLRSDLRQFAVPRHARWDPLRLMTVRQLLRDRLGRFGGLGEHAFTNDGEEGTNLILKLPGEPFPSSVVAAL